MNEARRTIYIVIPVYNRLDATQECLQSLRRQTYRDFKVVLVDDGSTDGTSEYLAQNYPEVAVLKGNGNLWWTGATNVGVKHALKIARDDDHVLTLNNDTVLPANYLEILMSLSKQSPYALIGSIALDYHRKNLAIDEGVIVKWVSAKFIKIKAPAGNGAPSVYPVSVLSGRGTLIPARVFRQIGLYDARNFPHYAADYDFSLRACKAGYTLLLHPNCYLYSKPALSGISNLNKKISFTEWLKSFSSMKSPNNLRIRLRFALRHSPILCRPLFIICDLMRVILGTFRNQIRNL